MRYAIVGLLAVVASGSLLAEGKERTITVTGTAIVYVKPDTARIHYGARVTEPTVDAAKEMLGKTTVAMEEAIKKLKLSGLSISAAPATVRQGAQNQPNVQFAPVAPGGAAPAAGGLGPFTANASFSAKITESNPEKLKAAVESFVKAITEAGANSNGDDREPTEGVFLPGQQGSGGPKVVLTKADESSAREEAFTQAVEKAMKNAKSIAKALGSDKVAVVSVSEGDSEKPTNENLGFIYGVEPSGNKGPAGEVEVKVKIVLKVSY